MERKRKGKREGFTAPVKPADAKKCCSVFLKPLVDLIEPKIT